MAEAGTRPAARKRVIFVPGDEERRQLIAQHPEAGLVSETLPLRANLSVTENVAYVLQFRTNTYRNEADDVSWKLLSLVSLTDCADRRDPDLTYEQRFLAKLLRAIVLAPPIILIDRPAQLLPDSDYPLFLHNALGALEGRFDQCWIVDYKWNAPLYSRHGSRT